MIFRFATPWALLLLLPAAAAVIALVRRRRRGDARLALPAAGRRIAIGRSVWVRIERALPALRALGLALLVLALARPQTGASETTILTHGVDIVVALDRSSSMGALDLKPNRLEVARRTIADFVSARPTDRIGLVAFAALAATRCPLTLDHAMLTGFLDGVRMADPGSDEDGTALGLGLGTAVRRLQDSRARSRVVVLVTDGRNNRGQLGPEAAAEAAKALGVRVYTIGVGTEGLSPIRGLDGRIAQIALDLDEALLRRIAASTGGRYYRATDGAGLQAIFEEIDALEKTEIESRERVLYTDWFPWLVFPAALLFVVEGLLLGTRLRRIP